MLSEWGENNYELIKILWSEYLFDKNSVKHVGVQLGNLYTMQMNSKAFEVIAFNLM